MNPKCVVDSYCLELSNGMIKMYEFIFSPGRDYIGLFVTSRSTTDSSFIDDISVSRSNKEFIKE